MKFEWDTSKAESNFKKHGVSFSDAATVFGDPLAITFVDPDHSIGEYRSLTFGVTRTGKFVIVSHTDRNSFLRIISVRQMTKQERKIYFDERQGG
jgi:uncharacterized DUF497 family protein